MKKWCASCIVGREEENVKAAICNLLGVQSEAALQISMNVEG